MKSRLLTFIIAALTIMAGATACRELPLDGELSGQWQITSIVYPDGRTVEAPQRYYCFYRHTAQLTAPGNVKNTANMIYDYPSISLTFPTESPIWLTDWGVTPPEGSTDETRDFTEHYTISRLTNSDLVMTTAEGVTITLRKY